ncbi:hypothetical protein [Amycolatopsis sp. WGS_07]|uniref:hypothetical protein n=1 Tax=Amycolatopsis sp. WGS_07 TaxID=3076764 RepID=UPI0038730F70
MSSTDYSRDLWDKCTGRSRRESRRADKNGASFPVPESSWQQALEAGLLLAAGEAVDWVHSERGTAAGRTTIITKINPFPHLIGLWVDDEALNGFLACALPGLFDGEFFGIPGLRARAERNFLELRLLGTKPQATARLYGVTPARWRYAAEFLKAKQKPDLRFWHAYPRQLHPAEDAARAKKLGQPDAVMSAVLRRYMLWADADWCDSSVAGDSLRIRWRGEPWRTDIAAQLVNPLCEMPGISVVPQKLGIGQRVILNPCRGQEGGIVADPAAIAAQCRAAFTGEAVIVADRGVGALGLGLDECSKEQRVLRELLALYMFNAGVLGAPPKDSGVHTISAYEITVSPRHDELVIFAPAADNVAGWLLRARGGRLPGLRLACRPSGGVFRLVHLPTGARLTVTSGEEPPECSPTPHEHSWGTRGWATTAVALREEEVDEIASLAPRSADMSELISAVFTRLCARDPNERWAIGTWWFDPLPHRPWLEHSGGNERRLWGANDRWTLEWVGYPYEDDLIHALTDPVIGNPRCTRENHDGYNELRLGSARLRLKPHGCGREVDHPFANSGAS